MGFLLFAMINITYELHFFTFHEKSLEIHDESVQTVTHGFKTDLFALLVCTLYPFQTSQLSLLFKTYYTIPWDLILFVEEENNGTN
jgi:hypothetical protein